MAKVKTDYKWSKGCADVSVLVACECSQVVCKAFRQRGFEAYSCDIQPCYGGFPEWHIQGDALAALYSRNWDLVIAHPPCTYLTKAGAQLLYPGGSLNSERYLKGLEARDFYMQFYNYPGRIAIENPTPCKIFDLPPYNQVIEPYMFGHPCTKRTLLWLTRLPILLATDICIPEYSYCGSGKHSPGTSPGVRSAKLRSQTFSGVAAAMADQWGRLLMQGVG